MKRHTLTAFIPHHETGCTVRFKKSISTQAAIIIIKDSLNYLADESCACLDQKIPLGNCVVCNAKLLADNWNRVLGLVTNSEMLEALQKIDDIANSDEDWPLDLIRKICKHTLKPSPSS